MSTDTGSFDLTRTLSISPERLWHLLTDGKMREVWGAPEEGMVLQMDLSDFRVGGLERHRCGPSEAPDFWVDTRWYHIGAPTDAAFTETIIVGGTAVATTLVTYRVSAAAGGAALHVNVAVSSFSGPEALEEIRTGWEGGLCNLEALVAREVA